MGLTSFIAQGRAALSISQAFADRPLFATNSCARPTVQLVGGRIPVLIVDQVFEDPEAIRSNALALHFRPPPYPYPGRLAVPATDDGSLQPFLQSVLSLVNGEYLPKIPPILAGDRRIDAFRRVQTDFAIVDVHPDELSDDQREPHMDPVPIFGLVYLNPRERGGTLFFDAPTQSVPANDRRGYCSSEDPHYPFVGRIEGAFNRLAIYPGFVFHSADIRGSWIENEERLNAPRLTQRLVFFP